MIETQHFCHILNGLQDVINRGETNQSLIGRHIVLSASFTCGTRYMFKNCQDAMVICKKFGYPYLFINITCNVNWSKVRDFVSPRGLSTSDIPNIACKVFKMKLDQMMTNLKKNDFFKKITAGMFCLQCYIMYLFIKLKKLCVTIFFFTIRYVYSRISKKMITTHSHTFMVRWRKKIEDSNRY